MSISYQKLSKEILSDLIKQHLLFVARKPGGRLLHLKFIDLSNLDFSNIDFSDAELIGVNLENSILIKTKFCRANLTGANLAKLI